MGWESVLPPKRAKRARANSVAATVEHSAHRPLTPVCRGCRYPLVRSDRHCPRCDSAVPWQTVDQPQGAVESEAT